MKTVLLYFLMIILLILLFLPPALRKFMPVEVDIDELEEGKNVITMVNCSKGASENLNFTYNNKQIKSLYYRVSGNKASYKSNEEVLEIEDNEVVKSIYKYGYPVYNETDNVTIFNVVFTSLEMNEQLLKDYSQPISRQKDFAESKGFTCTIVEMDA